MNDTIVEATTGVKVFDAMRRGLVDEYNVGGLHPLDLEMGLELIEKLYRIGEKPCPH
jgi:hypothetical protein